MKVEGFTGGLLETNAYLIDTGRDLILVDAPEGAADWLRGRKLAHLLLTHGHYDHMYDAARIKKETGCAVWVHPDSSPLIERPEMMLAMSPYPRIEAIKPDRRLAESDALQVGGATFRVLHCPGHCPGSVCFYHAGSKSLFGGDVLFAGGVGRWDLPGGSFEELRRSIEEKLYRLPDDTRVFPGHGPPTTIGMEKRSNPFVPGK